MSTTGTLGNRIIFFCCAGCAALVSLILLILENPGTRRVFYFESQNNELLCEARYLPGHSAKGEIYQYVEELLLGAVSPAARPLFPKDTSVRSCFLRGGTVYLDLSEEAVQITAGNATETKKAVEILKRNLFTNFKNIDIIQVYIVGKQVYEDVN